MKRLIAALTVVTLLAAGLVLNRTDDTPVIGAAPEPAAIAEGGLSALPPVELVTSHYGGSTFDFALPCTTTVISESFLYSTLPGWPSGESVSGATIVVGTTPPWTPAGQSVGPNSALIVLIDFGLVDPDCFEAFATITGTFAIGGGAVTINVTFAS